MNSKIVQLEKDIIKLINNANMPIAITVLILDKISKEANNVLESTLQTEREEELKQQEQSHFIEVEE